MERTHGFRLYRQSAAPSQDARGAETGGWQELTTEDIGCLWQPSSGRLVRQIQGRKVEVLALLLFHPASLPEGVVVTQGDIVVMASGRTPAANYLVADVVGVGERTGTWDDEAMLTSTDVDPTGG